MKLSEYVQMNAVQLLAEVLATGKGCPVCGNDKTKRARTCLTCLRTIGPDATKAVDAVAEASAVAAEGHVAASQSGNPVKRDVVWGPVLAQVKIDKKAQLRNPGNGIQPYYDCRRTVEGGFVSLFIFGASDHTMPGQVVTCQVELKTKMVQAGKVHYLRTQIVPGVKSNVKLAVGTPSEMLGYMENLPRVSMDEQGRKFAIGFMPAVKPQSRPDAALAPLAEAVETKLGA